MQLSLPLTIHRLVVYKVRGLAAPVLALFIECALAAAKRWFLLWVMNLTLQELSQSLKGLETSLRRLCLVELLFKPLSLRLTSIPNELTGEPHWLATSGNACPLESMASQLTDMWGEVGLAYSEESYSFPAGRLCGP